jgi:hypothetical protein
MKKPILVMFVMASILLMVSMAGATTITYTESATATGTLGNQSFTRALVTLTLVGDTANVTGAPGFYSNAVGTFTVDIAGLGTSTFTDAMFVFDNQGAQAAGFGDQTAGGSVLDTFDSAFGPYDLMSAVGPITNSNFIRPDLTFNTTGGGLNIQDAGAATFTATTVPEPGSLMLLGSGLAGFAGVIRRKLNR